MNEKGQLLTPEQTSVDEIHRDPMNIDIFDIPPHPAADVFPMLPDDELDELTADIRDNGLLMPLLWGGSMGRLYLSMAATAVRHADGPG